MLSTIKSIASLLLSYGLLLIANGLLSTLLGVRTQIEGFETEIVGIIMGAYFLGLLLGARYSVRVVANVGHIRSFAAFASIMSISALAHVLIIDPIAWMVMRIVSGFCMAGMVMVTESWLHERASNKTRGQVLSLYMITNYAAAGCGQFLLPLADPARFHLFSVTSIVFSLALVPVLLTRAAAPRPVEAHPINLRELYRVSPVGLVGSFCAGLVSSTFYGMGPIFTREIGLSLTGTSTFMASVILGGLVLQWPVGRLSDHVDRRWVLTGVTFAAAVACLAVVIVSTTRSSLGLYILGAVYGSLSFTLYSLSAAHTNDFADPDRLMQTASGLLIVYGVGAIIGPMVAAAVMGQIGAGGMFLWSAFVLVALGGFAIWRIPKRAGKEESEKHRFVPVPATQYTSDQLYTAARDQMDRDLANLIGGYRRR